jgi:hypothetical protein
MKPKRSQRGRNSFVFEKKPESAGVQPPASPKSLGHVTSKWLDEVSAGTEASIRDTPAWKEAVRRLGLPEVRRRLRLGCLASQFPAGSPEN